MSLPVSPPDANTAQPADSFAFVANVKGLGGRQSVTLAPGHELRRATPEEVAFIKETIAQLGGTPFGIRIWEHQFAQGTGTELPPELWRYFVIAFSGSNEMLEDVRAASHISRTELDCAFFSMTMPGTAYRGWGPYPIRLAPDLSDLHDDGNLFVDVTEDVSGEIAALFASIQAHDPAQIDVRHYARQLGDLKALPPHSRLRFLGRFALLESLLTHPPKPSDPYDSLTRQIVNKVALLNNRWTHRLDYQPFGGTAPDKVWTTMYAYRSAAAHGNDPDFKKDLRCLKSPEDASVLLQDTVKAVLRHALVEPQLMLDLKRC